MPFVFKPTRASRRLGRGLRMSKRKRTYATSGFRKKGLRARSISKFNVHSYKRMASQGQFTVSQPATGYSNSFAFTLSDVRNSSELTALYDQYKITGVKVTFQLLNNPDANNQLVSTTTTNATNFYPKLFVSRDYDDLGLETANDLRERNTTQVRILRPNSVCSFFVRPAVRNQLYLDGVTAANSPMWGQWLDCSSNTVPHYGMKFALDFMGVTTVQDMFIRVEKTYYIQFKNAR